MDKIPNCFYRISAKALVLNETRDKFLIVKEEDGRWDMPGGGIDWGESAHEALKREIDEEMGLKTISISKQPSYFYTCKNSRDVRLSSILYETVLESLDFVPSKECMEVKFVNVKELDELDICSPLKEFGKYFDPEQNI
jgi:8-oxo-dGTP diphosphatase